MAIRAPSEPREAPLRLASPLFGHCPKSDYTPPPALKRALWGTFFPGRFEQICQITVLTVHNCTASWQALTSSLTQANAHFNFNFHCISAPNHPGKGSDPPKSRKCPFELGKFFSKKVPQTIRARVLDPPPPPLTGNAQMPSALILMGLPLSAEIL